MKFIILIALSLTSVTAFAQRVVSRETIVKMIPANGMVGDCTISYEFIGDQKILITLMKGNEYMSVTSHTRDGITISKPLAYRSQELFHGEVSITEHLKVGYLTSAQHKVLELRYDERSRTFDSGSIVYERSNGTGKEFQRIECR